MIARVRIDNSGKWRSAEFIRFEIINDTRYLFCSLDGKKLYLAPELYYLTDEIEQ